MFVSLTSHLSEVRSQLGESATAYLRACNALYNHSNLRAYRDHLGIIRLCSADVNPLATGIEVTHRTPEAGGAIEVLPFVVENGLTLYADPPLFIVGYSNPKGFGEVPLKDWAELLADAGLSKAVIAKVRSYLGGHAPVDFSEAP